MTTWTGNPASAAVPATRVAVKSLAFAGRHLGQQALEHGERSGDLDAEVPLAEHAVRQLPDEREGAGDLMFRQIRVAA